MSKSISSKSKITVIIIAVLLIANILCIFVFSTASRFFPGGQDGTMENGALVLDMELQVGNIQRSSGSAGGIQIYKNEGRQALDYALKDQKMLIDRVKSEQLQKDIGELPENFNELYLIGERISESLGKNNDTLLLNLAAFSSKSKSLVTTLENIRMQVSSDSTRNKKFLEKIMFLPFYVTAGVSCIVFLLVFIQHLTFSRKIIKPIAHINNYFETLNKPHGDLSVQIV